MAKKILVHALNATGYGITTYTSHLVDAIERISQSDWDITVVTTKDVADRYAGLNCKVVAYPVRNRFLKEILIQCWLPLKALFQKYDLVHSVSNFGLWFSPRPQIITIHDTYESSCTARYSSLKRLFMKFSIMVSGFGSKQIIAVSKNTANDVARYYPYLEEKTSVIYSGCNEKVLKMSDIVLEKEEYALFVGTVEPGKNLAVLIEAFTFLKTSGLHLKIVGAKGWKQSHLPAMIASHGLDDRIDFLGYVDDKMLSQLYQKAKVFVLPSLYEGFGLPIIEALANGCPVIAAQNSAMPEAGGEAASYFETRNPESLAHVIDEVVDNPHISKRIEKGLKHAAGFTWDKCADETIGIYKRVLSL